MRPLVSIIMGYLDDYMAGLQCNVPLSVSLAGSKGKDEPIH